MERLAETTERGSKPIKPATVNRELTALRKALNIAVRQKRIGAAPGITMLAEDNARSGFLEPADFNAVADYLPNYLKDICRFAYIVVWRKSEVSNLIWSDVNRDAGVILLRSAHSKNKEPRILPLTGELAEIIERRWQDRAITDPDGTMRFATHVFHRDGRKIGDHRKAWDTACERAGVSGILFHDLRRSAARNLDKAGVSQSVAMKIMGHKTDSIYRRYRIVSESDLREALERTQQVISQQEDRRIIPMQDTRKG